MQPVGIYDMFVMKVHELSKESCHSIDTFYAVSDVLCAFLAFYGRLLGFEVDNALECVKLCCRGNEEWIGMSR